MKKFGLFKVFLTGGNSMLRFHCQQHWELYKKLCETNKVQVRDRATPPAILKQRQADAEPVAGKKQAVLEDMGVRKSNLPKVFTPEVLLEHVAKYICCTDAVSFLKTRSVYSSQLCPSLLRRQTTSSFEMFS